MTASKIKRVWYSVFWQHSVQKQTPSSGEEGGSPRCPKWEGENVRGEMSRGIVRPPTERRKEAGDGG